jgi:hypothetical protein
MKATKTDPVIDEVRAVRHRISRDVGHDPAKLVAYYMQLQEKYRDRLVVSATKRRKGATISPKATAR